MGGRLSDLRLALRLSLIHELDDGTLYVVSGTATHATLYQDFTFDFRVFLLLNTTLLNVDDALPGISHHLAAEGHNHRFLQIPAEGL